MLLQVYVAHPYGGDPENRKAAAKWVAFFARLGFAPTATWIVLTGEWDESLRDRGLAIDCEHISRSDVVVQVGPHISEGMAKEAEHARVKGIPVINLTGIEAREALVDYVRERFRLESRTEFIRRPRT